MTTPVSSMALVVLSSFIGSFGAVFLKAGAGRLERRWSSLYLNYHLALGVGLFFLSSLFFIKGVAQGELTVLYPMASLGYVWTLLWSRLIFHEPLTRNKFMGLGLILLGIVFLGLGSR